MLFQDLNIIAPILKALEQEGYSQPTPIQEQAIPLVLERRDLLGCAQTGTGKTAAFSIPLLQLMLEDAGPRLKPAPVRALILTPTRELAIQIGESIAAYGRHTGLHHTVIFGGVNQGRQTDALKRGVDILVATPGRLLDLMGQGFVNLKHLQFFVLDEADRMLDMGFIHDVRRVIRALPTQRQTLFFSATMPPPVAELASGILNNPARVAVTPVSSTAETVRQQVYFVEKANKKGLLRELLNNPAIRSLLVFTRTKHMANRVAGDLVKTGVQAEAIHGNKSQNARQAALTNFKNGRTRVLVATDIAARGIDIEALEHVLNYDLPNVPETYVHRIGRTGRAGNSGLAISFCDAEEVAYLKDIQKLIRLQVPVVEDHPFVAGFKPSLPAPGQAAAQPKPKPNHQGGSPGGNRNSNPGRNSSGRRRRPNRRRTPESI